MKTFVVAGLAAVATLIAAPVAAKTYICRLTENGKTNFIPQIVRVDQNGSGVTVIDPLIDYFKGAPISARIAVNNNRRITFSWRLTNVEIHRYTGGSTRNMISYRLTIQKGSNAATIFAVLGGFDNKPSGQGACEAYN